MEHPVPDSGIKTRFAIVSDTHGLDCMPETQLQHANVAIHCGDLTEESKTAEYHVSIEQLRRINAPLKLVIAGNHDFTVDILNLKQKISEARPPLDPELIRKEYGDFGEARQLFEKEKDRGIIFLDEGTHHFILNNGASLTVFASPFTPSLGDWGFQYHPGQGHDFPIEGADIVITHGPPKGIMDYAQSGQRAGCSGLFKAVAKARPRLHCFGHIHEGWGAKLVAWRKEISDNPSHLTDVDNGKSIIVANLSRLEAEQEDARYADRRFYTTSHCSDDENPVEWRTSTLPQCCYSRYALSSDTVTVAGRY